MSGSDLFISYARSAGLETARALRDALAARGISAFLDEHSIESGEPFPAEIADALLGARLILVLADAAYFGRPWCVYEFQAAVAPFRARGDGLDHVIVALPDSADASALIPYLPPPLARVSWPRWSQTPALIALIEGRLGSLNTDLAARFEGLDDAVIRNMRQGGTVPLPAAPERLRGHLRGLPATLKSRFVGRDGSLWLVHHELVTRSAEGGQRACLIEGGAGSGKSQLAAEYVWRFGPTSFTGGLVWIDAEQNSDALVAELHGALAVLDPATPPLLDRGADAEARRREIEQRLDAAVAALPTGRRVLWVVDNLPEAGADGATRPLTDFCPVSRQVSLLVTTRRAGSQGLGATVPLGELELAPAIALLTQPPVNARALDGDAWREIARWVGCLPLALKPLHDSLSDGYLSPAELLAKARESEPALAVDEEVEALREDIAGAHLRGVSEALAISYANLARQPGLQGAAHLVAWLSPVPVPDSPLRLLLGGRTPARLAARGWLQRASSAGEDAGGGWRMHRVYASFLRAGSADTDAELACVADWLSECYGSDMPEADLRALGPHSYVAFGHLAHWGASRPASQARARTEHLALGMATHRLEDPAWRGHRFLAAGLAAALGLGDRLVAALAAIYCSGGEEVARGVASMLHGLAGDEGAARLAAEILRDPRDAVRWQVLIHGHLLRRPDILARPLLQALMTEPNDNVRGNAALGFEELLAPEVPQTRATLSELARWLTEGDPAQRALGVAILGQLLRRFGPGYTAGGFRYGHLLNGLAHLALDDVDDAVAETAARQLGWLDDEVGQAILAEALGSANAPRRRLRALKLLGVYVQAAEAPKGLGARWYVEDGRPSLLVNLGEAQKTRPTLTAPLLAISVDPRESAEVREQALRAAVPSHSGKLALIQRFERAMDEGLYADVIDLAGIALRADPGLPTSRWWRAQAREAQGDLEGARRDFQDLVDDPADSARLYHALAWGGLGRVHMAAGDPAAALACHEKALALDPDQPENRLHYAYALERAGDDEAAIGAYHAYLSRMPDDVYAVRALVRLLERRDDHDAALAHLDRILELVPDDVEARFQRGYVHYCRGDPDKALSDLRLVTRAAPNRASAWHLMAGCLLRAGRQHDAVEAETRATELDPGCAECWLILAHALYQRGEMGKALAAVQEACALDPGDQRALELRDHLTGLGS